MWCEPSEALLGPGSDAAVPCTAMTVSDGLIQHEDETTRCPPIQPACLSPGGHHYPGVLNALSILVVHRVRIGAGADQSVAALHQASCRQPTSGSSRDPRIPCARCPAAINDSALKGQVSFSDSHMGGAVQAMFARLVPAQARTPRKERILPASTSALHERPHDTTERAQVRPVRVCHLIHLEQS